RPRVCACSDMLTLPLKTTDTHSGMHIHPLCDRFPFVRLGMYAVSNNPVKRGWPAVVRKPHRTTTKGRLGRRRRTPAEIAEIEKGDEKGGMQIRRSFFLHQTWPSETVYLTNFPKGR